MVLMVLPDSGRRRTSALTLGRLETPLPARRVRRPHLPSPEGLDRHHPAPLLGSHVDRRGRQRRMPEVLLRDLDRHATGDRVARVRMRHPVRSGLRKPLGTL